MSVLLAKLSYSHNANEITTITNNAILNENYHLYEFSKLDNDLTMLILYIIYLYLYLYIILFINLFMQF